MTAASPDWADTDWIRLAPVSALPRGRAVLVDVDDEKIALLHTRDGFRAVADHCRHMGGPLSEGVVSADTVTCPWHGWRYDLSTGARTDRRGQAIATYPVTTRDGWIYLSPNPKNALPEGEAP